MNANLCFSQEIEVVRKFNGINVGIEYCILERRIKLRKKGIRTYSMKLRTFPTGKHRARQIGVPPFAIVPFQFHSSLGRGP
jgi:hypothetical protein